MRRCSILPQRSLWFLPVNNNSERALGARSRYWRIFSTYAIQRRISICRTRASFCAHNSPKRRHRGRAGARRGKNIREIRLRISVCRCGGFWYSLMLLRTNTPKTEVTPWIVYCTQYVVMAPIITGCCRAMVPGRGSQMGKPKRKNDRKYSPPPAHA